MRLIGSSLFVNPRIPSSLYRKIFGLLWFYHLNARIGSLVKPIGSERKRHYAVSLLIFSSHTRVCVCAVLSGLRFYVSVSIHSRYIFFYTTKRFARYVSGMCSSRRHLRLLFRDRSSSLYGRLQNFTVLAVRSYVSRDDIPEEKRVRANLKEHLSQEDVSLCSVVSRICGKLYISEFEAESWLYLIRSYKCYFSYTASVRRYLMLQSLFSNLNI